ncbi:MAG: AmmeMemoRadiSam system radical SAM enzyme [Bacteroidota bacterium]
MAEEQVVTLQETLAARTKEGTLYEVLPNGWVHCYACGHNCKIPPGKDGICRVRFNQEGKLLVPWGYFGALQLDPVEKKPFFHAFPGALAMSFGMLGCDYHCGYCQNWVTSQALRDPVAGAPPQDLPPEDFVNLAFHHQAKIVTSTYNEPLITSEWAVNIFKVARSRGLVTSYVSNGNATPGVLDYIRPWVDLYKVDLKGFNDKSYRKLGGVLKHVLSTIKMLKERSFWFEVLTLIVPGFNDTDDELKSIAQFLVSVDPDIPWHVTAFHSDYKMKDTHNTPSARLVSAAEIGYNAGLRYVYAGNLPGQVGPHENTYCPSCKELLVERWGFKVLQNRIADGACPKCKTTIPGVWTEKQLAQLRLMKSSSN